MRRKRKRPKLSTCRKRTAFLWKPVTLPLGPWQNADFETRWLEKASWIEQPRREHPDTIWEKAFWLIEEWERDFGHLIEEI